MNNILKSLIGAAALSLIFGSVYAADMPAADEPMVVDSASFNWDGFYAGVGVTATNSSSIVEHIYSVDGIVGVNVVSDSFLFGAEAYLSGAWSDVGGAYWALGGEIRAGALMSDAALIYASAGAEHDSGGANYGTLGAGVEFVLADNASLDLEYKHYFPIGGAWTGDSIGASVLWHFD